MSDFLEVEKEKNIQCCSLKTDGFRHILVRKGGTKNITYYRIQ